MRKAVSVSARKTRVKVLAVAVVLVRNVLILAFLDLGYICWEKSLGD